MIELKKTIKEKCTGTSLLADFIYALDWHRLINTA